MPPRSTKKPPASAARATRPGRGVAAERSPAKPTPAKQYRQIDGVRYDDKALGVADDAVKARGKIALSDARKVFESVLDGPGITRVEYDTLAFVANGGADGAQYRVVASAKAFLLAKMVDDDATAEGVEDAATTVKKKKRKRDSLSEANSPTNAPATTTATTTATKTKTKRKKTRETIVRRPETTPTPRATTDDSRRRRDAAKEKKKNDASGLTGFQKKKRRHSSHGAADSRGDDGATISDDTFSSDDAETVVKKRVVKRRRASAERTNYENELRNRAVRFAETETKTADDDVEKKTGSGAEKKTRRSPGEDESLRSGRLCFRRRRLRRRRTRGSGAGLSPRSPGARGTPRGRARRRRLSSRPVRLSRLSRRRRPRRYARTRAKKRDTLFSETHSRARIRRSRENKKRVCSRFSSVPSLRASPPPPPRARSRRAPRSASPRLSFSARRKKTHRTRRSGARSRRAGRMSSRRRRAWRTRSPRRGCVRS